MVGRFTGSSCLLLLLRRALRAWRSGALSAVALLSSCHVGLFVNSAFEPQVINQIDNFQLAAPGLKNLTRTVRFAWLNTGTRASVTQASLITSGSATLRVQDAPGAEVFSNDLSATGAFLTRTGVSGAWTIEIMLTNASGNVSFRVQKSP
jgi:hypothetical protein